MLICFPTLVFNIQNIYSVVHDNDINKDYICYQYDGNSDELDTNPISIGEIRC